MGGVCIDNRGREGGERRESVRGRCDGYITEVKKSRKEEEEGMKECLIIRV